MGLIRRARASTATMGAVWMVLAGLMYTITGAMVRELASTYSVFEVGFFRSLIALVILLPFALGPNRRTARERLKTDKFPLHVLRTVLAYIGIMCWFFAVSRIPLAEYYALQFVTPLFTMAGATLLLGERTGYRHWLAALVGLAGALVILRPGLIEVSLGAMVALGAALFFASTNWTVRVLSRTDSARVILTYGNLLLIPMSLIPALPFWVTPDWADLGWLCGVGVTGTIAQFSITRGGRGRRCTHRPAVRLRSAAVCRGTRLDRLRRSFRPVDLDRRRDHLRGGDLRAADRAAQAAT